jgi:hypothetical protein
MANYATVGCLGRALDELYQAVGPIRYEEEGTPAAKLRDRIYSVQRSIERIEKAAKKMIPGGFQAVRNEREEDKRAQRESLSAAGGAR